MKYNNNEAGIFKPDDLFIDASFPVLKKGVALKAQQGALKRGTVICKNETGEAVSGSKTDISRIVGVLTDDIETALEGTNTTIATVYRTGHFNKAKLTFAAGTTFKEMEQELAKMGIFASTIKEV